MIECHLFDPDLGVVERDRAIEQAAQAAPDTWTRLALRAVQSVSTLAATWTTDDIWARLDEWDAPPPPEPRAMGAVLRQVARDGIAVPTDRTRPTDRPGSHRRPIRIWRTL